MRGEGAGTGVKAISWTAPVLGGSKDSRSHGINCATITVSLRQLRERRGILRLRRRHPAKHLERMYSGSSGKRGWSLNAAVIGCSRTREFGASVAGGELGRVHTPCWLMISRSRSAQIGHFLVSVNLRLRTFVARPCSLFMFCLPVTLSTPDMQTLDIFMLCLTTEISTVAISPSHRA